MRGSPAIGSMMLYLLTKRIRALNSSLAAFRAGDFDARITTDDSPDEVGEMARTFNSMAESVQRLVAELAESDRRRRELVSNISHDLRTPLTAAIGNIEIIGAAATKSSNTVLAEHSERAARTLDYLSRLVSELFELAKLEAKVPAPKPEWTDE